MLEALTNTDMKHVCNPFLMSIWLQVKFFIFRWFFETNQIAMASGHSIRLGIWGSRVQTPAALGNLWPRVVKKIQIKYSQPYSVPLMIYFARRTWKDKSIFSYKKTGLFNFNSKHNSFLFSAVKTQLMLMYDQHLYKHPSINIHFDHPDWGCQGLNP